MTRAEDERWMRKALEAARCGEGLTRPNPPVGAALVKGGRLVAVEYHHKAGAPHAEALVLKAAGNRARGATLYVTLEPCSTRGRTPPCTEAILRQGVSRVVVAVRDPNPRHAGRGLRLLRKHGLEVVEQVCREEALSLIEPFGKWIRTGRPCVTLKLGMTLDGRIADGRGRSRWITGPAARTLVQAWRRRCDAILIGSETARLDNPSLLPRPARGRKPWRVVLSSDAHLPGRLHLFADGAADRTIVMTTERAPLSRRRRISRTGAGVVVVPEEDGRPSVDAVMEELGRRGILHVLCEGGGEVAQALMRAGAVDQLLILVAPMLLGGRDARSAFSGQGWALADAPRLQWVDVDAAGDDLVLLLRPGTSIRATKRSRRKE